MNHFYVDTWVEIAQRMREEETQRAIERRYWRDQLPAKPRRPSRVRSIVMSFVGLFL